MLSKLFLTVFLSGVLLVSIGQMNDAPTSTTKWLGFTRVDFQFNGHDCILVQPYHAAKGKPWIWRTEFFGHEPQADSSLLSKGFYVAFIDMHDLYGAPAAIVIMDSFYHYLVNTKHLHPKTVLEGFSRGGLYALNWAAANPSQTGCIYLDAPVCDFKSWPGGKGKGAGSAHDWQLLKSVYGFQNDADAIAYQYNPVDNYHTMAAHKIPILSVCGTADTVVPVDENSQLLKSRYEKEGGYMMIIEKKGVDHHPHSLKDPAPIVDFIIKNRVK
jgi:pimeloyl-ACP methyl ester carboxylesterase